MAKKKAATTESFDFPRRAGTFVNVNTRHENHGKDSVQLCADISVRGFHIERAEYEYMRKVKNAWALNFVEEKGKPPEPLYRNQKPTQITDEYEGCDLTITLGLSDSEVLLEDVFVSKIVLDEQVGGTAIMDFMASFDVDDTDDVARLLEVMGDDCNITLSLGAKHVPKDKKAQQKLDLGPGENKPPADSSAPAGASDAPAVH